MKISRRALAIRLERTGAPPPRPSDVFVDDVEARLRGLDRAPVADIIGLPTARPIRRIALGALAAAAAVVVVIGLTRPAALPGGQLNVGGRTSESTASTTAPAPPLVIEPPTTTLAPPLVVEATTTTPPTTVAIPSATTTTTSRTTVVTSTPTTTEQAAPTTTTSVRAEPTSTTTRPYLLQCNSGTSSGQASVSCGWSESRATNFAGYRLYREVPGTSRELIFATADRGAHSFIDNAVVQGQTYNYSVESVNAAGDVIERWPGATVACC